MLSGPQFVLDQQQVEEVKKKLGILNLLCTVKLKISMDKNFADIFKTKLIADEHAQII